MVFCGIRLPRTPAPAPAVNLAGLACDPSLLHALWTAPPSDTPRKLMDFWAEMWAFWAEIMDFWAETLQFWAEITDFCAETLQFWAEITDFWAEMLQFRAEITDFWAETLQFWAEITDFCAETLQFWAEVMDFWAEIKNFWAEMLIFRAEVTDFWAEIKDFWAEIDPIVTVVFQSPPRLIFFEDKFKTRFVVSENGHTLSIPRLRMEDAGTYSVNINRKTFTFTLQVFSRCF
uniref:Uncharacterized protein n=1 Tax=Junco hyemalis TaxID=40217 RepID=A0A8C5IYZ3_JUNHY